MSPPPARALQRATCVTHASLWFGLCGDLVVSCSIFLGALAVFLVVLSKASTQLEEKAREYGDQDEHANDAAFAKYERERER